MYIQKLNEDDFDVLALLLVRCYDFTTNVKNVNENTLRLTIKPQDEKDVIFMVQDFRLIPACELAADMIVNEKVEDTFFRFMKQKFGYKYELELCSYLNNLNIQASTMLNQ